MSRTEEYYRYLATGQGAIPKPLTREEQYLYALCTELDPEALAFAKEYSEIMEGYIADAQAVLEDIEDVQESIPEDYSTLSADVTELKSDIGMYERKPFLTVDSFAMNHGWTGGVINNNQRACVTMIPFDVRQVYSLTWTGVKNTSATYHVMLCYYSDQSGSTVVGSPFELTRDVPVIIPDTANYARLMFMYYSSSGIASITHELFDPYFGVEIVTDFENQFNSNFMPPVFDKDTQYYIGDIVTYNDFIYVFQADHIGAWSTSDIKSVNVTVYFNEVKQALTNYAKLEHDGEYAVTTYIQGNRAIGNVFEPTESSTRCTVESVIYLNPGDIISVGGDFSNGVKYAVGGSSGSNYYKTWANTAFLYTVENSGFYTVNFKKVASGEDVDITPDDIEITIVITKGKSHDSAISSLSSAVANNITGDDLVFVHVSDTHIGNAKMPIDRAKRHMNKVMEIAEAVNADFIVHTGDLIQGSDVATTGSAEEDRSEYKRYFEDLYSHSVPFVWCQGNPWHDFGHRITDGSNEEFTLTRDITIGLAGRYGRRFKQYFNAADTVRSYYYFDIDMAKTNVRVIVLDADDRLYHSVVRHGFGFSSEQVTWFGSALTDANTNNMPVIVFTHMAPLNEFHTSDDDIEQYGGTDIVAQMQTFISGGGTILECVCGHLHCDMHRTVDDINYHLIACDFPTTYEAANIPTGAVSPSRANDGTLTEYAIDVHVVNASNGTVKTFRYGAGNSSLVFPTTTFPIVT